MHERIKEIRESLGLNQLEFAKLLGMGQSTLGMMEVGKRNILDRHIKTICSICNVNEEWLKYGTGEMFIKTSNELLDQLAAKYNLKNSEKQAFEALLTLNENDREKISNLIKNLFNDGFFDINKDEEVTATQELDEDPIIDYELKSFRQELKAEQKGEISSVSENLEEKDLA